MNEELKNGNIVLVRICSIDNVQDNDIVAYRSIHDEIVIHRVVSSTTDIRGNRCIYTKGDNNNKVDTLAVTDQMIIGKVVRQLKIVEKIVNFIREQFI